MNAPVTKRQTEGAAEISAPHVLQAIDCVTAEVARAGIAKDRRNSAQGYDFRGIDDVYNALAGIIAENHLVILPKCVSRTREAYTTAKGGNMFSVTVEVEYRFKSAVDGSEEVVGPFPGEAMDSGDKATNKAMSAAYKYMAMQTFCIPTKGDNDADASTHVAPSLEDRAISHLRACAVDRGAFKDAWEANRDGWKKTLDGPAYARVVAAMRALAEAFPKDEPPPEREPIDDVLRDEEIPY